MYVHGLYSLLALAYPNSPPEHPTHSLYTCCKANPMIPTSRVAFSSYRHTSKLQSPLAAPLAQPLLHSVFVRLYYKHPMSRKRVNPVSMQI
ncbi:hypothetical protein COCCADRAFT_81793 [Bipolaris zeicola 26-R-13]|uniref:Uncharacterized protein n=1 Tax=Cochliobolus carbonum (strain 26-R-13) TaxID=930089 RepID=W6YMD6_COCC2|nr:uncharacterized protein COCCADRAFT_81793 [Bipolaris zeicola 26-R-13]EUC38965.1 hypothetical protein COCCADRAFT_81793 [Bipolaris zeicola 26-R-13]